MNRRRRLSFFLVLVGVPILVWMVKRQNIIGVSQIPWNGSVPLGGFRFFAPTPSRSITTDSAQSLTAATALFRDLTYVSNISLLRHEDRILTSNATGDKKLILFYNRPDWYHVPEPKTSGTVLKYCKPLNCELTDDRSVLSRADAVMVHVCLESTSGLILPATIPPGQVWVAFGLEAWDSCGGTGTSGGLWKNIFHLSMSYRRNSDLFKPYGSFIVRQPSDEKHFTEIAQSKTKPVAWFVTHCYTPSRRDTYVKELQKYIQVDIYGACGPLRCSEYNAKYDTCTPLLNSTYYFYLAFENALCTDYVTEKLFKTYENVDVIPVVRGGADYDRYFPAGTFINTADFGSPRELALHLHSLVADKEKYAKMLRTKDSFFASVASGESYPDEEMCRLCERLYRPERPHVNADVLASFNSDCHDPTDIN